MKKRSRGDAEHRPRLELRPGHTATVHLVAFAPDGKTLASASEDGTLKLWDVQTGELLNTLLFEDSLLTIGLDPTQFPSHGWWPAHADSLAFLPDGRSLVTANSAGLRFWHVRSGVTLRRLPIHEAPSLCSPDGRLVSDSNGQRVWDTATGKRLWYDEASSRFLVGLACFSGDGTLLVRARLPEDANGVPDWGAGATIEILDARTGAVRERIVTATWQTGCGLPLACSPDGRAIATKYSRAWLGLLDATAGEVRWWVHAGWHKTPCPALAFSPDGKALAIARDNGTVGILDTQTGAARADFPLPTAPTLVRALAFSPGGALLAAGSDDTAVRLYDAARGQLLRTLGAPARRVRAVALSPDGGTVAAGGADGAVRLWDARAGVLRATLAAHQAPVCSLGFSPDGRLLASAAGQGPAKLWDPQTGALVRALEVEEGDVASLAFSPNGATLAAGGTRGPLRERVALLAWFDPARGEPIRVLPGHDRFPIEAIAFSSDGRTLASLGGGYLRLRDARSGALLATHTEEEWTEHAASLPDCVVLGSGWHEAKLLNPSVAGHRARRVQVPWVSVSQMAISPDCTMLAAGYRFYPMLTLWSLATGEIVRTLNGHTNSVRSVAWSRDGTRLVSGSEDGTVKVWDPAAGRLLATLAVLPGREETVAATDWVAFTPEGHFVGSEGATSAIGWRVGDDVLPFEEFGARFSRPDLVAGALLSEAPAIEFRGHL